MRIIVIGTGMEIGKAGLLIDLLNHKGYEVVRCGGDDNTITASPCMDIIDIKSHFPEAFQLKAPEKYKDLSLIDKSNLPPKGFDHTRYSRTKRSR